MIKGLSLFSNVGIGELFLEKCGIEISVANELDDKRALFYKNVYPDCDVIAGDINQVYDEVVTKAKKNNCKFIIATPPCQGMSVAGKRNYDDERNQLIIPVLKIIKEVDPDYVLIENVPQILKLEIQFNGHKGTVEEIINREFSSIYKINSKKIVNAEEHGIPQKRKRAIILLSKKNNWELPEPEGKIVTVRDVIGNLPSVEAVVDGNIDYFPNNSLRIEKCKNIHKWHYPKNHSKSHVTIMRNTKTGRSAFENEIYYPKKNNGERIKGYNTTYKRMEWDKPAPTITMANGVLSSQCNVHPGRLLKDGTYSDARVLTVYEVMKLFTIPDDWKIPEWANENFVRKVIGEAIPPLLIEKIIRNLGGFDE